MDVKLTNLGMLIEGCWSRAENETILAIARKHPAPQEDEITFLFCGELRAAVEEASNAGRVESTFLADLLQSTLGLDHTITWRTSGLIARVNRHPRWHEGKVSAADLGVVVVRPLVQLDYGGTEIKFIRDNARGLLAQAKLGRQADTSKDLHEWDGLTEPQKKLYPKHREYYSLLLYRLRGPNSGELRPFGWQLCREHTVKQVQKWLRKDAFPEEMPSSEVIRKLFAGSIGTDDPTIIRSVIDPSESIGAEARCITVHIFWPDGKGPPPSLQLHREQQECQQTQQRVRR